MMKMIIVAFALTVSACSSEPVEQQKSEFAPSPGFVQLPDNAPFKYYGKVLLFRAGTLDARMEGDGDDLPFARIVPRRKDRSFGYFIEIGRNNTGRPSNVAPMNIGFPFSDRAVRTKLNSGYTLWCEPNEEEHNRGACAVQLRSLPLAALRFTITTPPSDTQAEEAIKASETLLQSMVVEQ